MKATADPDGRLQDYCSRFQSPHCDQHEGRPRPHMAVMLLPPG